MARKPDFFSYAMSLYEVVTADGLMRPALAAKRGGLYCGGRCGRAGAGWGLRDWRSQSTAACTRSALTRPLRPITSGSARMVEKALGVEGDDILYVGGEGARRE
jgi:hypothetical protein